jgi:hypothetical protein
MNSKSVLGKIMTLLSLEVAFTDAQTKDGTILQSPTFDLGESVDVVSEDGAKTPAPDGEHEIALKDSEGNEVIIRIETKDGKITSRENVEEANPELEKVDEEVVDKEAEEVKMADATTEEAHPLPNTTDEDPRNSLGNDDESVEKNDPLISLSYRIDELEKALKMVVEKMGEESPVDEEAIDEEAPSLDDSEVAMAKEDEEEELPKLDGAPLDVKMSSEHLHTPNNNYGKKVNNPQGSFLSKLYR